MESTDVRCSEGEALGMTKLIRHGGHRYRLRAAAALGAALLVAAGSLPAAGYSRPTAMMRVSLASDGSEANGHADSAPPAISADGRYVAFWSQATNLVPGDKNNVEDVFVHDRVTGETKRASVAGDGTEAKAAFSAFHALAISADGRHVAFGSAAPNLVPGDGNGVQDVFVHDRLTGSTERASVAGDGTQANAGSLSSLGLSADGRYVAFASLASNLVPGDRNAARDVFVHDRVTGSTERVSVADDGTEANALSESFIALSADGRSVAFVSGASNLVPGDGNGVLDVFVHDRETGETERISVASDGTEGNDASLPTPAISASGRYVAFPSTASNLVPGDANAARDVFVHDRETGKTERVSVATDGTESSPPTATSFTPAISADGRFVAFVSDATNLAGVDGTSQDLFVHDRFTGETERASAASDGTQDNFPSFSPALSGDGRYIAFVSTAPNLVPDDTNNFRDVFVRDRGESLGLFGPLTAVEGPEGLVVEGTATFSGATVVSASDPADDGETGAEELGAELTSVEVVSRVEREDLLIRLGVDSFPARAVAGLPGVVYGLELEADATRYQVRALVVAASGVPPRARAYVGLFECATVCLEIAPLTGSIGSTGNDVLAAVPLAALGVEEGAELTSLRAFSALGEAASGGLTPLDEVDLDDAAVPVARVDVALTPDTTPEDQVAYEVVAGLLEGDFQAQIPTVDHGAGVYRVWARACLGDECEKGTFMEVWL